MSMFSEKTRQLIAEEMQRDYLHAQRVDPSPKYIWPKLNRFQRIWRAFCRKVLRFDPHPPIRIDSDDPKAAETTIKKITIGHRQGQANDEQHIRPQRNARKRIRR